MIRVQEADFDAAALSAQLRETAGAAAGAMVTFTGYVRDYAADNATEALVLEHYPGMCEQVLGELIDTARARWGVAACTIVHRVGRLERREQIVFVGVASPHRGEAFRACEFLIDALKTRAPFWKREELASGEHFWVEQKADDRERTQAWAPTGDNEGASS